MAKKPLEIDACAGSQLRDTQGEMLSVEGADISELQAGKGRWNDNHGKGFFNSIGRITDAKKIFKEEDCDNDRQRYYWNKVKAPYVYVKGYLYDDEDHPNARAAAAILRNVHKTDCPLKLKASVEGGVVSRGISDPSLLARTKIHSVALTFTPANVATLVEPTSLDKSQYDEAADMELIKSVIHLAETNVPSFRHIARDASASKVRGNIEKIAALMKGDKDIEIPSKQDIIQYALESKISNNVEAIRDLMREELEKAREDLKLPPTSRKAFRSARKKFNGRDKLADQVTSAPGVSDKGIEARRGDSRVPGARAHGYGRVFADPKRHMNTAKQIQREKMVKEDLDKGIKDSLTGAAMMGAAALAPHAAQAPVHSINAPQQQTQSINLSKMPPEHQKAYQEYSKKNPLLGAIGMVESSGGQNYAHKTIEHPGMHQGQTAGGMFGMMPNAAEYALRNDPKLASKYAKLVEATKDMKSNHSQFTDTFNKDPQAAFDFADSLIRRNKTKTKDINMLIHSWNHGLKGTWDRYKKEGPEAIKDTDYVKKVLESYKKLQPQHTKKPAKHLKKALTAGYGGAGAPTSATGGSVLQTEALDDGRGRSNGDKSFKYVVCDDCGKDQIYSKYQVKCRDCGKSFPMEKLHKLFLGAIAT